MKSAAILVVAVVMMMSPGVQSGSSIPEPTMSPPMEVNLINIALDAQLLANINVNAIANLDAAISVGVVTRARVMAILGLDARAFANLWLIIDANVNGRLDIDELVDLELMIYIENLLDVDVDLNGGALLDIDINLTGNSASQCRKDMSHWWSKTWTNRRQTLMDFFKKRELLKRRIVGNP